MPSLSDAARALMQRRIADLIRAANPAERAFRASRVRVLALSHGRQTMADETLLASLASIAAVCFDEMLWDACCQVRQAVVLDDALLADQREQLPDFPDLRDLRAKAREP